MLSVSASPGVMVLLSRPPRWYCWLSAVHEPYLAWFREPSRSGWASCGLMSYATFIMRVLGW